MPSTVSPRCRPVTTAVCAYASDAAASAPADLEAGRGPLVKDLAAEAEECGRTAPGRCQGLPRRLDELRSFDEAAEVLLVKMAP